MPHVKDENIFATLQWLLRDATDIDNILDGLGHKP